MTLYINETGTPQSGIKSGRKKIEPKYYRILVQIKQYNKYKKLNHHNFSIIPIGFYLLPALLFGCSCIVPHKKKKNKEIMRNWHA